jgi:plastocyanin
MGARSRERRSTRTARRHLLRAAPFVLAFALIPGASSSAEGPTIEATGNGYSFYWSPSSAQTTPGGTVNFKSPSASIPHGVAWSGGPAAPACSGVPVNGSGTSWSGGCTFPQAGSYAFYCTVHPTEMKGTITASSGGTPDPTPDPYPNPKPPPPTDPDGSPLQGPASQALKLAKSQRGNAVRGSVALSQAAVGGKLDVRLLMAAASLPDSGRAGPVTVGRQVRGALKEGRVKFAVALRRVARRALEERGLLSLKVRLTIAPPGGKALVLNRSVTVHG